MKTVNITPLAGILFIVAAAVMFASGSANTAVAVVFLVLGIVFLGSAAASRRTRS